MIIEKKFVVINMPKTGSTFVRNVIRKYYRNKYWIFGRFCYKELQHSQRIRVNENRVINHEKGAQHGICAQIPDSYLDRQIVSVVRNPTDRLISLYTFGYWKKGGTFLDDIVDQLPHFPDLSLDEFAELWFKHAAKGQLKDEFQDLEIGPMTTQYIYFYAKDPIDYFRKVKAGQKIDLLDSEHFHDVRFIHMENLNAELFDFLKANGFSEQGLQFILEEPKRNVSRKKELQLNPETAQLLRKVEQPLYEKFTEYA